MFVSLLSSAGSDAATTPMEPTKNPPQQLTDKPEDVDSDFSPSEDGSPWKKALI